MALGKFQDTLSGGFFLAEFEHGQCCFFELGERGRPAERVADEAVDALEDFPAIETAIDHYLADLLLMPLALMDGTSRLSTSKITPIFSPTPG